MVDLLYVSSALLFLSSGLIVVDAMITKLGLSKGLYEVNPILRILLDRFGSVGLAATRIVAVVFLVFLYSVLDPWVWLIFGAMFTIVVLCVVSVGVRNLWLAARGNYRSGILGETRPNDVSDI